MTDNTPNQDSLEEKLKVAFNTDNSDKNYNARKALVSSIPGIGSLLITFFDSYIVAPSMERIRNFLKILIQELEELKSKIELVDYESPAFQTIVIRAYQIAARTHQEQKLEALRNIVLNSSIPRTLEDDMVEMFLVWVDNFTELHISTLKHLHYLDRYAPGQLDTYFPMLEEKKSIYNKFLKDLADEGLIILREGYFTREDDPNISLQSKPIRRSEKDIKMKISRYQEDIDTLLQNSRSSSQASRTTELGKKFIKFIEYPSI